MEEYLSAGITAVVYCYNSAPRIGAVLQMLYKYFKSTEILVVNDGSTDWSELALAWHPVRIVKNETPQGKGNSLRQVATRIRRDFVFVCDAQADEDERGQISNQLSQLERSLRSGVFANEDKLRELNVVVRNDLLGIEQPLMIKEEVQATYHRVTKARPALSLQTA